VFRIRDKGLPRAGGSGRGDAHVRISLEIPAQLSDQARAILAQLDSTLDETAYPRRKAFRARARDAGKEGPS